MFPFIEWLQAIGSEVAAETSRSAEISAPEKIVTISRAELKVVNILSPLVIVRPDHRAHAINNARGVPNGKSRCFSVVVLWRQQNPPANDAACWRKFPQLPANPDSALSGNGQSG
jgi:hypothetical protein